MTILLISQKRKKRSIMIIKSYISIAIKKTTMPVTTPSQKTSISFGNLYVSN